MSEDNVLLSILLPLKAKEEVVDRLMSLDWLSGFTIRSIEGHSREHANLSIREQVQGYKQLVQFDIMLQESGLSSVFEQLTGVLQPGSMRYWVVPVRATGRI
ncbi:DUF3240 family protein [Bowmanella pacifica]|uniref:DUF3240 domain-containing protein n=1 Tax=Bowmanella pacifica TaxID=502051 RepID=A0A918DFS5_9ALTE|nr:DUF3240 family protein [Bowmanella pacifica]GGO63483.1 hypothetical protein GCM10010982_00630 [Bowmanella pacifica]